MLQGSLLIAALLDIHNRNQNLHAVLDHDGLARGLEHTVCDDFVMMGSELTDSHLRIMLHYHSDNKAGVICHTLVAGIIQLH